MPLYKSQAQLPYLEFLQPASKESERFRFPVQRINRTNQDSWGYDGILAGGGICVGDELMVTASLKRSRVKRIDAMGQDLGRASKGEAVTLFLEDDVDISVGDILHRPGEPLQRSDQFQAHLIWMHDESMLPQRSYLLSIATQTTPVQITDLKYVINPNSGEHLPATKVERNEMAICNFATTQPIAFDSYAENRETGAFSLIDRISNRTVANGMIDFGLHRGQNLSWQSFEISRASRAKMKNQQPVIVWFTGLSASGKSQILKIH